MEILPATNNVVIQNVGQSLACGKPVMEWSQIVIKKYVAKHSVTCLLDEIMIGWNKAVFDKLTPDEVDLSYSDAFFYGLIEQYL